MRAVAARLGVSPNALYSHVESKAALVDELLDETLGGIDIPAPGADPLAAVHAVVSSSYDVLLSAAELIPGYLVRQGARGPNALRLGDAILGCLERAGVTGPTAREALHVLIVYAIGAAAFSSGSPLGAGQLPAGVGLGGKFTGALPAAGGHADRHAEFEQGLRWLLAGITAHCSGEAFRRPPG
jgi:AcrR family transcriptional regulator